MAKINNYKHIRVGNIEYFHDPDFRKNFNYEHTILRWYPNTYFGRLDEYLKDGYVENGDFLTKENLHVDRKMFNSPEMNCVIAHLELNEAKDEYDIVSIGRRLIDLDDRDTRDLHRVMDIFDEDFFGSLDK